MLRTAPAPLFALARRVRERGCKVVLTGEGADEMFGGYDIFKEAKIRSFWGARPESKLRPKLLSRLYPYLPVLQRQSMPYLKAFFRVESKDLSSPSFSHLPRWEMTSKLKMFFSDDVRSQLQSNDVLQDLQRMLPPAFECWQPFHRAQYLETGLFMPGHILSSQGDRMAMAHGIEARFPFLDSRVVEFAAALPLRLKMKVLNEKYILKQCSQNLIPNAVSRRYKQPYRAPDSASFFGNGASLEYVENLLGSEQIRGNGIFKPNAVSSLVNKCRGGEAIGMKDNMALVGILSTQLIIQQFIQTLECPNETRITQVYH
jgi:asparagine synthase (glutamine-hydrolysing)